MVQLGNFGAAPLTAGASVEVYGTKMGVETLQDTVQFPGTRRSDPVGAERARAIRGWPVERGLLVDAAV